jgi:hypothetical protein
MAFQFNWKGLEVPRVVARHENVNDIGANLGAFARGYKRQGILDDSAALLDTARRTDADVSSKRASIASQIQQIKARIQELEARKAKFSQSAPVVQAAPIEGFGYV